MTDVLQELRQLLNDDEQKSSGGPVFDPEVTRPLVDRLLEDGGPFHPGDMVVWKEGLKNRRFPDYNQPVVVVRVLDGSIIDDDGGVGASEFGEPLTLEIAVIAKGNLETYLLPGRRMKIFKAV